MQDGVTVRIVRGEFVLVLPDEPAPVRLMNTIWADRHGVHDALTTPDDLRAWLSAVYPDAEMLHPSRIRPGDVRRFRALRDAVRDLAALITSDTRPRSESAGVGISRAVAAVNDAAALAVLSPRLVHRDGELRRITAGPAGAVDLALSSIAQEAIDLLAGAGGGGLRACHAPGCVLYFVKDHPRREWCSTACGNRVRAARHYERHKRRAG
jgi:predicted RNA-binding Zn ribbon-like protein